MNIKYFLICFFACVALGQQRVDIGGSFQCAGVSTHPEILEEELNQAQIRIVLLEASARTHHENANDFRRLLGENMVNVMYATTAVASTSACVWGGHILGSHTPLFGHAAGCALGAVGGAVYGVTATALHNSQSFFLERAFNKAEDDRKKIIEEANKKIRRNNMLLPDFIPRKHSNYLNILKEKELALMRIDQREKAQLQQAIQEKVDEGICQFEEFPEVKAANVVNGSRHSLEEPDEISNPASEGGSQGRNH